MFIWVSLIIVSCYNCQSQIKCYKYNQGTKTMFLWFLVAFTFWYHHCTMTWLQHPS